MTDDWAPIFAMPESDSPIVETFDPSWPYNLKFALNGQTGAFHMWRVAGGTDGRPYHRKEFEQLWGREPRTFKAGVPLADTLGLATYIPAERKLDGTVVAPPTMLLQAYYGHDVPQQAFDWVEQNFPGVAARRAKIAAGGGVADWQPDLDNEEPVIKWVWNQNDGVLIWQTDAEGLPAHEQSIERFWNRPESPKDHVGFATPVGAAIEMDVYKAGVPNIAFSAVKAELSKLYPNKEILLPDAYDKANDVEFIGSPAKLGGEVSGNGYARRRVTAAEWAQQTFEADSYVPSEASVSAPNAVIGKADVVQPPLLVRGLRRVMGLPTIAASGADKEGAMVAVFLPEEVGKKVVIKGGEPLDDLHITLAYFVDKQVDRDDWDEVARIVEQIANQTPKLTGSIGGYGVFQNDVDILWGAPSVPGLAELRHKVVEACNDAGFQVSEDHGWAPHITLKYDFKGKLPRLDEKIEVTFDQLSFAKGDEHTHFDFDGAFEKKIGADNWAPTTDEWRAEHPDTGESQEYGPQTWSGWQGAHRFVTDGREVVTEPEEDLRVGDKGWHGGGHPALEDKFVQFHPQSDIGSYVSGWVIPTKDELGYGIFAPGAGLGGANEAGLHDVMSVLDDHFGKPTHFVTDERALRDPDLYKRYPEGGQFIGLG